MLLKKGKGNKKLQSLSIAGHLISLNWLIKLLCFKPTIRNWGPIRNLTTIPIAYSAKLEHKFQLSKQKQGKNK